MRDWPSGVARRLALDWAGTAVEREILAPTAASAEEPICRRPSPHVSPAHW
jgi:hypothetical protein